MTASTPRRRIAFVVQRYGADINGGAELFARQIAERLVALHDVTVLTSCARDYTTWAAHYPSGEDHVNGVRVLRFENPLRNDLGRARIPKPHKLRYSARRLLSLLPGGAAARPRGDPGYDGLDFLRRQGPHCPGLLDHLRQHPQDHDLVVFLTALYEPIALGLPLWGARSILVPMLHDEKAMYLPHFRRVFAAAGRLFYNTEAERRLATRLYGLPAESGPVVGVGVDVRVPPPGATAESLARLQLPTRYLVYVGRIDGAKGCDDLVEAFEQAAAAEPDLHLVLVGQRFMELPAHPRLHATGFISDADRDAIVAGAQALVLPSRYESLSLVLLEAMGQRVPVLANAVCEVLADHVTLSGGGFTYGSPRALARALLDLWRLPDARRQAMGEAGARYVAQRYGWDHVMAQYAQAIEALSPVAPAARPA